MTGIERALPVAALLLAVSFDCHAGRPLATEDADILAPRECEWEGFVARESASGSPAVRGWTTQLGCGVGYATQVALAYGRARSDGATAQAIALVGKTGLIARQGDGPGLTLAWTIAGEKPPGGSFEHEATQLSLVATKAFTPALTAHANLGWLRSESARASSTTWNLAAEYALDGGFDLMGEVYGDDRARPWVGIGARWRASEALSLNASWASQSESPRVRLWTIGFKFAF